ERRKDWRSGDGEQIEPDMNRAMLVEWPAAQKEWSDVQQPRFVVSADREFDVRVAHRAEYASSQIRLGILAQIPRDERTCNTQIQHDARGCLWIHAKHGRH